MRTKVRDLTQRKPLWTSVLYLATRLLLAPLARFVFRPAIEGRANIPRRGPVILASNHLSFVDSIVIPLVAPRRVVFLAKAEYFEGRGIKGELTRWFFTALGSVPVDRGTHRAAQASLEAALRVLAAGEAFGIYPEGSRSRDGRLYRGRTGVAWLALTARAPVVPVALVGTDLIQPVGSRLPRIRRVTIRFGTPLHFGPRYGEAGSAQARRVVTDEIMVAIGELSKQECAGRYNDPISPPSKPAEHSGSGIAIG
jgi:1-acyl-sn-glycerol-3-phosphate acyltransferase